MSPARMTASERRAAVLAAAVIEFARSGYAGTSTEAIATRAGISQPYLFRLFGTKKGLFIATYELVSDRIIAALARAGAGRTGEEALAAIGEAYGDLLQDPELLRVQLHGFSAAPGDEDIAATCRRTFEALWHLVHERTRLPDEQVRAVIATGMLLDVISAIDPLSVPAVRAGGFRPAPGTTTAVRAASRALRAAPAAPRSDVAAVSAGPSSSSRLRSGTGGGDPTPADRRP